VICKTGLTITPISNLAKSHAPLLQNERADRDEKGERGEKGEKGEKDNKTDGSNKNTTHVTQTKHMTHATHITKKTDQASIRILAATGCIGYGFTELSLNNAMAQGIDFIGADAGSMDPGPFYLGAGKPYVSEQSIYRDLRLLLLAARKAQVPLIIGSCGGSGGTPHLALTRAIVERIISEEKLQLRLAIIASEPSRDLLVERFREGRIHGIWPAFDLDEKILRESTRIVAMMGSEPLKKAISEGADVILAGRCSDSAIYAAIPEMLGFDKGLAWHLAKTIECGATVATPKTGQDCVVGTLERNAFIVEPPHPDKQCTVASVAAHTMYENPSPFEFIEPSGVVDTSACHYEKVGERAVRVTGSKFTPAEKYTVKLEGAHLCGWRAVTIAGIRDPILISRIREFSGQIQQRTANEVKDMGITPDQYTLNIRRYGLDAVLGDKEPQADEFPHEIGLMLDVIAQSEQQALTVLAKARYISMHTEFEGRLCTAGNVAMPFSPSDISVGPAYRFSVWHAMELDDPLEIFPIEYVDFKA